MVDRYAIAIARFNEDVTAKLLTGALGVFQEAGIAEQLIDIVHVPGSFELPLTAKQLASSAKYAAIVCLGAVIKGDTDHYEHVCRAATDGILRAGMDTGVPVIFGVLTCKTEESALERAGGKEGNKGADAARAAIEMAKLLAKL